MEIPQVASQQLKDMIDAKENFVMVDIRKGIKADKFWIEYPNKILTSLDGLEHSLHGVSTDEKVVIVDAVGKRSAVAARYLYLKGYTKISRLSDGVDQWFKDGFTVGQSDTKKTDDKKKYYQT